jgi:hypothetical protein
MLQVWISRCAGEWVKDGGGDCRSMRTRLWDGFREERRRAVERPMPEAPPVMSIVLGVDCRVVKALGSGVKRDILVGSGMGLVK